MRGARLLTSVVVGGVLTFACGDNSVDSLDAKHRAGTTAAPDTSDASTLTPEEALFRVAEPDLMKNCGKTCHDTAQYQPTPPAFLAGPDAYKSIKAQVGIVVRDVYQSALLTKGPHAGPALKEDPVAEKKVTDWLEAEAILIQSQKLPSTPPFIVTLGPNDVDLSTAAVSGLTGVHMKFDAAMVGSMLSLTNLTIVAPAGPDVHLLQPRFVRVLAQANTDGLKEIADPADSFSNSDQTVPNGKETALAPGAVLFSAAGWRPWDQAQDKLRIEFMKLEPGKVSVIQAAASCKDVGAFTNNVLPTIRQQQTSVGQNCQNCHGNGLGGLNLASQDTALICQQILQKLTQSNIPQSLIVTKVSGGMAHNGGTVPDANAWRTLFVNNAAVFY